MKRRIVIFFAISSALACIALVAVLIVDRPIHVELARVRIFYYAGSVGCDVRSGEPVQGPRENISDGAAGPYIVNFSEIEKWRQQLPFTKGWSAAGVSVSHRYRPQVDDNRQWRAGVLSRDRERRVPHRVGRRDQRDGVRRLPEKNASPPACARSAATICARRGNGVRNAE